MGTVVRGTKSSAGGGTAFATNTVIAHDEVNTDFDTLYTWSTATSMATTSTPFPPASSLVASTPRTLTTPLERPPSRTPFKAPVTTNPATVSRLLISRMSFSSSGMSSVELP